MRRPNLVFLFADQMRADAAGYAGDPLLQTPNLDRLAREGLDCRNAIAGCPVCTPWRACLLTGQYPLTHGLFLNDLRLPTDRPTFGTVLRSAGYRTGYIGKWHLDGNNRSGFTPPGPRRQGFDFWAVANCCHDYLHSFYYRDDPALRHWEGYDAIAQTDLALEFIGAQDSQDPFALFLSFGPPHNPYDQVPRQYLERYRPEEIPVRANCPQPNREELRGYYAHITALDEQVGRILGALRARNALEETVFVFTSDHGDMLGSQGQQRKQRPWEESIHVPLLIRAPGQKAPGAKIETLLNAWDLMPTLLGFLGLRIPESVEGRDLSPALRGEPVQEPEATLISLPVPFSEYRGQAWRGVRTAQHTYVRTREGPWLLYDNRTDPYQLHNLVEEPKSRPLRERLERLLVAELARFGDRFEDPEAYLARWGYQVRADGAIQIEHRPGATE